MVPKKQFLMIGLILIFTLLGFHSQAQAEPVNNSVKECLEQPDACGEQQVQNKSDSKTNSNTTAASSDSDPVGLTMLDFVKMIMATVFVIGLLYFVLKFVNKKSHMFKRSQLMENLGGVPLGANRSLQMIKVGNRLLVIGVGENIQLLKEIEDEKEYEQILSDYNSKLEQLIEPSDLFAKMMRKIKERAKKDRHKSASPFQSMLKQQLDDLIHERKELFEEVEKSEERIGNE